MLPSNPVTSPDGLLYPPLRNANHMVSYLDSNCSQEKANNNLYRPYSSVMVAPNPQVQEPCSLAATRADIAASHYLHDEVNVASQTPFA